ncbi:MAG: Nudix family hydrolase [Pseudomonadales bacterium]|nr:Nudix family hydrolase [Pseudomonadales bacterium]MCP5330822.1 Nudix family hydrolase [Pseudomonadales bacterium]
MKTVHVAVGAITDSCGRVLVALRPQNVHQGGLWEFPGGKCEPGESIDEALRRELQEELGIRVSEHAPLCCIRHDYPDKRVLLEVRRVLAFTGEAQGREGQPLRWADIMSLDPAQFPAANAAIIQRLQMPDRIAITAPASDLAGLRQQMSGLLQQKLPVIHLRQPALAPEVLQAVLPEWQEQCRQQGSTLVLNSTPEQFARTPTDGLHVSARLAASLQARPVAAQHSFSVSCHSRAELEHAQRIGADYALLSPVASTTSHPDAPALGWQCFAELIAGVNLPIYALGGMQIADIPMALRSGAVGVAAISAFA